MRSLDQPSRFTLKLLRLTVPHVIVENISPLVLDSRHLIGSFAIYMLRSPLSGLVPVKYRTLLIKGSDHRCVLLINTKHTNSQLPFTNLPSRGVSLSVR